ncbi:globin domain-containing protein [Myroides injenensis]|uniref:globin domain-containing protein n=1 Tax=Myroides injenensis TaxID=1183151 RepID=UPI00226D6832|nr:globin domain-containing protein [Myroides injenensis]
MLSNHQKKIVLQTADSLRKNSGDLLNVFYTTLFEQHPEVLNIKNLGDLQQTETQSHILSTIITCVEKIAKTQNINELINTLKQQYAKLEISPEQYEIMGSYFIQAIMKVLKHEAVAETRQAWETAAQQIVDIILANDIEQNITINSTNPLENEWNTFVVKSKVEESDDVISLYLTPISQTCIIRHLPGQYLQLKMFLPSLNKEVTANYSISSTPNEEYYRITIKRVHKDAKSMQEQLTNYLYDHLAELDLVALTNPKGNFTLNTNTRDKVFLSGGIGQSPLISMLETIEANNYGNHKIVWIHTSKNKSVQAFKNKIRYIANNYPLVTPIMFYDQIDETTADLTQYQGQIDFDKIKEYTFTNNADYYLSGSKEFVEKLKSDLKARNINENQIFFQEYALE